jgi:excisionase family DNA binding protein
MQEQSSMPKRLFTLDETARELSVSVGTIRRLVSCGGLPVVRVSGSPGKRGALRVERRAIERLIAQNRG